MGDVRIAQMRGHAFGSVLGVAVANYPAPKADGHSFAADPKGKLIARAGSGPELLTVNFDMAEIRQIREQECFRWQR